MEGSAHCPLPQRCPRHQRPAGGRGAACVWYSLGRPVRVARGHAASALGRGRRTAFDMRRLLLARAAGGAAPGPACRRLSLPAWHAAFVRDRRAGPRSWAPPNSPCPTPRRAVTMVHSISALALATLALATSTACAADAHTMAPAATPATEAAPELAPAPAFEPVAPDLELSDVKPSSPTACSVRASPATLWASTSPASLRRPTASPPPDVFRGSVDLDIIIVGGQLPQAGRGGGGQGGGGGGGGGRRGGGGGGGGPRSQREPGPCDGRPSDPCPPRHLPSHHHPHPIPPRPAGS